MDTKICKKCGLALPIHFFTRHKQARDGLQSWCKKCKADYQRTYTPPKQYASQSLDRKQAYNKAYRQRSGRAARESNRKWNARNPEAVIAHKLTLRAISLGFLVRGPCEVCGEPKAHAHHDDYSQPLTVRWLCPLHHRRHHAGSDNV